MAGDSGSKTEKATPKKRRDERKKGNIFQSKDVVTVFSILAVFYAIKFIFPFVYNTVSSFLIKYILKIYAIKDMTVDLAKDMTIDATITILMTIGPIMLIAMLVGIIASGVQTKFLVAYDSMKFKFSRMSFGKGLKRLFSMRSIVELLKSMIKVTVICFVLYNNFMGLARDLPGLMDNTIISGIMFIFDSIMTLVIQITIVFGAISGFDYLYQWWDYEKNLKMSKQEIKEEYKHMEGDPQVKGKIREKQRQMAQGRMMQAVPTADVIIRNPTHYAIALRYDIEKDDAPVVVAKGKDLVALKIIEIATEHKILMTENKLLARALYETVEPNRPIPPEFYTVLAEIMAWAYSKKNKLQ